MLHQLRLLACGLALALGAAPASAQTYWNVFNVEGERTTLTATVTYATRADMLADTNRTGVVVPSGSGSADLNIIDAGSDGTNYWNLFNVEGERTTLTAFATYNNLMDMLADTNRTGVVVPSGGGSADLNIIGAGSDGTSYWNVFNVEGERTTLTAFATYATLSDMLHDTNRTDVIVPSGGGSADLNIVGSGSDGTSYWNLFNVEDERTTLTAFVTYATLGDMMHDTNRLSVTVPSGGGSADLNIIGTGSDAFPRATASVPEPATWALLVVGFGMIGGVARLQRQPRFA
jgi:hypothetical protein